MICDELSQDEIFEALLLYASLHGICEDVDEIRRRVAQYTDCSVPDSTIDEAIVAYLDDEIVAPPDIVLNQWGSSRLYELAEHAGGDHRHRVCETWFENGCCFPEFDSPSLTHLWTNCELSPQQIQSLRPGDRLRLVESNGLYTVVHRQHGTVGSLPGKLTETLPFQKIQNRRVLVIVDRDSPPDGLPIQQRLLLVIGDEETTTERIIDYAEKVFFARRTKC